MKKAGFIIFAIGIVITIFTGASYVTKEVVIESGDLSITRDASHGLSWSPLIGVGIIILGVAIFIAGLKKPVKWVKQPVKS